MFYNGFFLLIFSLNIFFPQKLFIVLEKINSIREKILEEILKINNLFEKTNDELTKSFQKKHEQLNKEDNDIREKLQNKVTKTKE